MFYWVMKRVFLGPVLRTLFRPWVKGLDNVPAEGAAIIASNHLSFSDSIFMPLMVPRPVIFLAKSEYFTGTGLKGRMTALFFRLTNQLPMDRSGGAASAASLETGMDVLTSGGLLGIYPEGTRSPDARLYRGKVGVARLALQAGVPVIPVAMIGTDKVQPIGKRLPNIRRIGMIFGEPLDFSRYQGMAEDRLIQRSVTDEIMYELMRLSGQEYVDEYAAVVKLRLAGKGPSAAAPSAETPSGGIPTNATPAGDTPPGASAARDARGDIPPDGSAQVAGELNAGEPNAGEPAPAGGPDAAPGETPGRGSRHEPSGENDAGSSRSA
ncbi:1-acyl-sn-glycerol-3-phosphate acyltransferase [Arthrobacter sp. Bi83]|uniref:1-acyl-sn-glycerol-3-phosphate acyltransferase n=1 Tax=Arthrobacter sp. Bi83 TaxID=2822353 RepID=UPI001D6F1383|nr:1-acyl-sn-glycerol-3-phosphate acyltransferase [Arthrobacter sp. Bi83]CAH0173773.1 1-acyl-sn-glycerol-3-phosphate acyltransferase [Arthrobacter sp. Bi83]